MLGSPGVQRRAALTASAAPEIARAVRPQARRSHSLSSCGWGLATPKIVRAEVRRPLPHMC
eukprot:scaffold14080_cov101-Isochrysis_galbana.AAC.1